MLGIIFDWLANEPIAVGTIVLIFTWISYLLWPNWQADQPFLARYLFVGYFVVMIGAWVSEERGEYTQGL